MQNPEHLPGLQQHTIPYVLFSLTSLYCKTNGRPPQKEACRDSTMLCIIFMRREQEWGQQDTRDQNPALRAPGSLRNSMHLPR